VQLRDARLVHADLAPDLLHGGFAVVVEPDYLLLARRQRPDGGAHLVFHLTALVRDVRSLRLRWEQHRREHRFVPWLCDGQWRGRLDCRNADDRAVQALLIAPEPGREIRERRLAPELAPQLFACGLELASLAAHATRPCILSERVDHRAPYSALRERLELDAARLVETVRRVDETDDAVLNQVADVNGVRHGRSHPSRQRFDEREPCDDPAVGLGSDGLELHWRLLARRGAMIDGSGYRNGDTTAIPTTPPAVVQRGQMRAIDGRPCTYRIVSVADGQVERGRERGRIVKSATCRPLGSPRV